MPGGRPPKPTALKILQGTARLPCLRRWCIAYEDYEAARELVAQSGMWRLRSQSPLAGKFFVLVSPMVQRLAADAQLGSRVPQLVAPLLVTSFVGNGGIC